MLTFNLWTPNACHLTWTHYSLTPRCTHRPSQNTPSCCQQTEKKTAIFKTPDKFLTRPVFKKSYFETGEIAQWLGALAAIPEDLSLIKSHNCLKLEYQGTGWLSHLLTHLFPGLIVLFLLCEDRLSLEIFSWHLVFWEVCQKERQWDV